MTSSTLMQEGALRNDQSPKLQLSCHKFCVIMVVPDVLRSTLVWSKIPSRVFCVFCVSLRTPRIEAEGLNSTDSVMSAEPGRKTAYSNDLRWRIVYQGIAMNLPLVKIAQNIAVSTVHRIYRLFEESGTVDPLSPRKRLDCRRLNLRSELHVVGVILENPSMYLGELCFEVMQVFGTEISPSTVCRTLKRYGLARKKFVKLRCSDLVNSESFMAQCSKREMLVWVDETGSDSRDNARRYGYALRGVTPTTHRFVHRGRRTNAMLTNLLSRESISFQCPAHSTLYCSNFLLLRGVRKLTQKHA